MKKETIDWASIVKDWEQSGESKKEYCSRRGIAVSSMYSFLSRTSKSTMRSRKTGQAFVEVPVDPNKGSGGTIVIRLASGVSIEVPI